MRNSHVLRSSTKYFVENNAPRSEWNFWQVFTATNMFFIGTGSPCRREEAKLEPSSFDEKKNSQFKTIKRAKGAHK